MTSSTYSKGGTKLLKGGTKLLKGGTKLLKGGTKLLKGGTKLLKCGTKLLKGGTKSLGWATGGGSYDPPDPPPGYGPDQCHCLNTPVYLVLRDSTQAQTGKVEFLRRLCYPSNFIQAVDL